MANVVKRKVSGSSLKRRGNTNSTNNNSRKNTISLPTEKRKPTTKIEDFTWLIYGDKKIGKTSLTSCFPNALIYSFEPGTKALEVFAVDIPNWDIALTYNDTLVNEDHNFQNIVIDTGKIAYDRCMQYTCKSLDIKHPGDLGFGKGWHALAKNFEKMHLDITGLGLGLVILAHDKTAENELPSGLTQTRIEPDLSGAALSFYQGMVDIIARYHYINGERFLTIRGDEDTVAGCRMSKNFLTPDGEKIFRIPMGTSEEEAYKNLYNAFHNKQTKTYKSIDTNISRKRIKK